METATDSATQTAVLCRYGELFLKGGNRRRFEETLRRNVARALAGIPDAAVKMPRGRLMVTVSADHQAEAARRLERVFGLVSLSPGVVVARDMDAICAAAVAAARREAAAARPRSFKIETRRSDKTFPLESLQISAVVGERVLDATQIPVDVHTPDLHIGVEVGHGSAFVHAGRRAGPGGLPAGSAGRGLLLLSGGIDSPVAGWLAAKRGLALDAIYFHSPPFVGEKAKDKVLALARVLAGWQAVDSVTVVSFTEVQKRLRAAGPAELAVVLYRRMMMRIADAVADGLRAAALVTGENLGQVASQTITNMSVIDAAARRLVVRPLVTYDKVETTALARRIGTFDTSILPFEDCCSLFVPAHPATAARLDQVERVESKLDVAAEAAAAAAAAERIPVGADGAGQAILAGS